MSKKSRAGVSHVVVISRDMRHYIREENTMIKAGMRLLCQRLRCIFSHVVVIVMSK